MLSSAPSPSPTAYGGELSGHERAFTAIGWRIVTAYVFRYAAQVTYLSPADMRTVVESLGNLTKTPSLDPVAHKMSQSIKSPVDKEAIDSQVVGFQARALAQSDRASAF